MIEVLGATKENRPLVYLAAPYSDPDPAVRNRRFLEATRATAKLITKQECVYSPITYTHAICQVVSLDPLDEGWYALDERFLRRCSKLIVLQLPGWEKSNGVTAEIEIAREMGIPVEFLEADYAD